MIGQFIEVVSDGDKYMKRFITKRTFVDFYFFSILYLLPCLATVRYSVHIFFALLAEAGGGRDTRRLRATTVRSQAHDGPHQGRLSLVSNK